MTSIYDQYDAAFQRVSAYVVLNGADHVATVALKFPRDGAGRLWAYVHWHGVEMARGFASGCGYDKRSAAVANAARKAIEAHKNDKALAATLDLEARRVFFLAIRDDSGKYWDDRLRDAGFTVLQAV